VVTDDCYGVGYDNVDVAACTEKEIYVTNVTDYCPEEVSGQALLAGGLPVAEITFRTAAAEEAIQRIANEIPDVLMGPGEITSSVRPPSCRMMTVC